METIGNITFILAFIWLIYLGKLYFKKLDDDK